MAFFVFRAYEAHEKNIYSLSQLVYKFAHWIFTCSLFEMVDTVFEIRSFQFLTLEWFPAIGKQTYLKNSNFDHNIFEELNRIQTS